MRAIDGRSVLLRGQRLPRRAWETHVVVVLLQRWQGWWLSVPHLGLLLLLATLCSLHDLCGAVLVCWVVEQGTNVVHEQRVQKLGDLLLVGEI